LLNMLQREEKKGFRSPFNQRNSCIQANALRFHDNFV
jgi:hypothetical protein